MCLTHAHRSEASLGVFAAVYCGKTRGRRSACIGSASGYTLPLRLASVWHSAALSLVATPASLRPSVLHCTRCTLAAH